LDDGIADPSVPYAFASGVDGDTGESQTPPADLANRILPPGPWSDTVDFRIGRGGSEG